MPATAVQASNHPGLFIKGSFTLDPANIATVSQGTETAAIPEAKVGDLVIVSPRATLDGGIILQHAYVSAAGTVTIVLYNVTGGGVNIASAVWDYVLIRGVSGLAHAG